MLGRPLASREWRLSASQAAVKELMAAAMAAAKAENRTVTKNQKKKLKKKIKKQLTAAASTAATSGSAVPMVSSMSVNSADLDGSTANSDLAACQVSFQYTYKHISTPITPGQLILHVYFIGVSMSL